MAEIDESKAFINELLDARVNLMKTLIEVVGEDLGDTDCEAVYHNYMDQGFMMGGAGGFFMGNGVYTGNASLAGLTVDDLRTSVFTHAKPQYLGACLSALSKYGSLIGLTEKGKVFVLAQMALESGGFIFTYELGRGKGKKYGVPAGPYGKIYYGRGPIQITWENNYKTIAYNIFPKMGINANIHAYPELCEMNLEIGCAASLAWFMLSGNGKRAIQYANDGNVKELTHMINGGYAHLNERIKYTEALLTKTQIN